VTPQHWVVARGRTLQVVIVVCSDLQVKVK